MPYRAEYIWIDGQKPTAKLRSKTKIVPDGQEPPIWGFDGSSTEQAPGSNSDCVLRPVMVKPDPIRGGDDVLVMAEVLLTDFEPHESNTRAGCLATAERYAAHEPWFGIEQEYTFYKDGRPHGWPIGGFPAPQGGYYCGVGADEIWGRDVVEAHTKACIDAGIAISGTNAEVMIGQWEFQIGPLGPVEAADELWMARWLLYRIAEDFDISAHLNPKPVDGDWNGAGAHTNFSTTEMRQGYDADRRRLRGTGQEVRSPHPELRGGHRAAADRSPRDGAVDRVQLRRLRPRRLGPDPVAGGEGEQGLHRGSSSQRQLRPVRRHPAHHRDRVQLPRGRARLRDCPASPPPSGRSGCDTGRRPAQQTRRVTGAAGGLRRLTARFSSDRPTEGSAPRSAPGSRGRHQTARYDPANRPRRW